MMLAAVSAGWERLEISCPLLKYSRVEKSLLMYVSFEDDDLSYPWLVTGVFCMSLISRFSASILFSPLINWYSTGNDTLSKGFPFRLHEAV